MKKGDLVYFKNCLGHGYHKINEIIKNKVHLEGFYLSLGGGACEKQWIDSNKLVIKE